MLDLSADIITIKISIFFCSEVNNNSSDKSIELKNQLIDLKPDVFVVVAYKILPEDIINIPQFGSLNLHASLLPKYRGAGPIQWALMNGDKTTGVTIFQIKASVDTGDILMQKEIDILENDNMLSLGMRLCTLGADLMILTPNQHIYLVLSFLNMRYLLRLEKRVT